MNATMTPPSGLIPAELRPLATEIDRLHRTDPAAFAALIASSTDAAAMWKLMTKSGTLSVEAVTPLRSALSLVPRRSVRKIHGHRSPR